MIIWSGRGFVSVLVLILSFILLAQVFPEGYSDYVFITSLLITAALSWFLGKRWNVAVKVGIDEETGQDVSFKPNHSLFWIKMQYWGFIFAALALIILVQQFI